MIELDLRQHWKNLFDYKIPAILLPPVQLCVQFYANFHMKRLGLYHDLPLEDL